MPVWLRKFTVLKLNEHYSKQKEQYDKLDNSNQAPSPAKGPNIKGKTYTTKARK